MNKNKVNTKESKAKETPPRQLPGSVATFIRQRDGQRIFVYPKKGESTQAAVARVASRNGTDVSLVYTY